jgi:hypothetical protein
MASPRARNPQRVAVMQSRRQDMAYCNCHQLTPVSLLTSAILSRTRDINCQFLGNVLRRVIELRRNRDFCPSRAKRLLNPRSIWIWREVYSKILESISSGIKISQQARENICERGNSRTNTLAKVFHLLRYTAAEDHMDDCKEKHVGTPPHLQDIGRAISHSLNAPAHVRLD